MVSLFMLSCVIGRAQKITYYRDVQPVVHSRCATCHRPGGGAPFSLITFDDIAKRANFVKEVVASGYMPPWKANDHYTAFSNSRKLTDEERNKILNWIEPGTPRGQPQLRAEKKTQQEIESGTN